MKIVREIDTTKAGFSEQNQSNIKHGMTDLQNANYQCIKYNACLSSDNKNLFILHFLNHMTIGNF